MAHLDTSSPVPSSGFLDIDPGIGRSVALPLLVAGTLVTVHTRNTVYRLVVVDGSSLRVAVTGGRLFQHSTEAAVLGAIDDDGNPKIGWIEEGRRLELHTDSGPVITSVVESVGVDVDPTSVTGADTEDETDH
jgi:hypothetical protein